MRKLIALTLLAPTLLLSQDIPKQPPLDLRQLPGDQKTLKRLTDDLTKRLISICIPPGEPGEGSIEDRVKRLEGITTTQAQLIQVLSKRIDDLEKRNPQP